MGIDIERLKVDREYWDGVAPEGATHYSPEWESFFEVAGLTHKMNKITNEWELWELCLPDDLIPRPAKDNVSVKWDGKGLPPVGCECEVMLQSGKWEWCQVKAHSGSGSWIVTKTKDRVIRNDLIPFRPIRTKEQRQREELIEVMLGSLPKAMYGEMIASMADDILSRYNLEPKQ